MKKRGIYALLMALCLFSLATLYSHIARVSCSFVITGAFSKEQANRFTTMLNSNELVTASASYSRENWATLQDEHQRAGHAMPIWFFALENIRPSIRYAC